MMLLFIQYKIILNKNTTDSGTRFYTIMQYAFYYVEVENILFILCRFSTIGALFKVDNITRKNIDNNNKVMGIFSDV